MSASVLNRKVLVLNKSWLAVDIWPIAKAVIQLVKTDDNGKPKAKVIQYALEDIGTYTWGDWAKIMPIDGEAALRSPENKFRVPEVILLQNYNGFPKKSSSFSRRAIYKLYDNTCQYCSKKLPSGELNLYYILPQSRGGKSTWENVVLACIKCNSKKGNRTPQEAGMKLIYGKPKIPKSKFDIGLTGDIKFDSWKNFLSEAYWLCPLKED